MTRTRWVETLHPRDGFGRFSTSRFQVGEREGQGFESAPNHEEQAEHYASGGFVAGPGYTPEQMGTLDRYMGIKSAANPHGMSDFGVNTLLRERSKWVDEKQVEALSDAVNANRAAHDFVAYRGLAAGTFPADLKPGDEFEDLGFMSVSANPAIAWAAARHWTQENGREQDVLEVGIPEGTPIAYNANAEDSQIGGRDRETEQEFLLDRGRRIRVVSIRDDPANMRRYGMPAQRIIRAELV